MRHRWWQGIAEESYWLESTDRSDIGADLNAPLADGGGRTNWRYTLFHEAKIGDIVFHYDKKKSAITSYSYISAPPTDTTVNWVARGKHARLRQAKPTRLPGYRIQLRDHTVLDSPLTLEEMRRVQNSIQSLYDNLKRTNQSVYFPFQLGNKPLKPLQGYAFKLPRKFVELFPALKTYVKPFISSADIETFQKTVLAIEATASNYRIANLQKFRAQNLGISNRSKTIFSGRLKGKDWTFHSGGRTELQFNVGIDRMPDGTLAFRSGVAFSFEPSRSFPNIYDLVPKVAKFNVRLREDPRTFSDLSMWHWSGKQRSADYVPGPIPSDLVKLGNFVFLGDRQPLPQVDPHSVLTVLDRLFPLYKWVESRDSIPESLIDQPADEIDYRLRPEDARGVDGRQWIKATYPERVLDIFLRHAEIQRRLKIELDSEGYTQVKAEVPTGQRRVDLIARRDAELWFFEIKTASTARLCLREAVGQLLEYAFWPGAERPSGFVVVGEPALDPKTENYIAMLNSVLAVPLRYRQLSLAE